MAVLAVGVVGAAMGAGAASTAFGAAIGLTTAMGVSIGWSVGTLAGQYLFGPSADADDVFHEGPRLGDTVVKGGSYGQPIPRVWGQDRVAGGIIWKQPIREDVVTTVTEVEGGGGKGGKGGNAASSTQVNYFYYASFAIQLCEGPAGIRRVWMNSKLVRDPDNGRTENDGVMTIYEGSATQVADPTMETYEGVGNVPAYRDTCYIVFDDLPLSDFNNMIPNIEVEVLTKVDVPPSHIIERSFGNDRVYYTEGDTVYTVSAFSVSNGGSGTKEIDYTRSLYELSTGTLISSGAIHVTSSVPNSVSDDVYIIPGSRYVFMAEALLPTDPESIEWGFSDLYTGKIYTYDIVANGWKAVYYAPRYYIESGSINYTTGDVVAGAVSDNELWFAYVRESAVIIIHMPDTFSQAHLEWWYETIPDIVGFSPIRLMVDKNPNLDAGDIGIPYILLDDGSDVYLTQIDLTAGATWTKLVPDLSVYSLTNPGVLIRNNWMFVYSSSSTVVAHRAYHIGVSSGALIQEDVQATGPTKAGGEYFVQVGADYALSNNGLWLAFDYLYDSNIEDVIAETCEACGLLPAQYNSSAVDYDLTGYTRSGQMSGRSVIEGLQRILAFDAVESDGVLKFIKQDDLSGATGVTIDAEDLGAHMYGTEIPDEITMVRGQELEMPREVVVAFKNITQDYDIGVGRVFNPVTPSKDVARFELPAVMTQTQAKDVARRLQRQALHNRISVSFSVSTKHLVMEPADLLTVSATHGDYNVRLNSVGFSSPSVLEMAGTLTDAVIYDVGEGTDPVTKPPSLPSIVQSTYGQMSIPIIREADAPYEGHYAYAQGLGVAVWPGASLYFAPIGVWSVASFWGEDREATFGELTSAAGSTLHPWSWDESNSITVTLTKGDLTLSTDADVQAGTNRAAVGIDGRWEIIGFVSVVDNGDKSYTLSRLLRGLGGSEMHIGTGNTGDTFVLLDDVGVRRVNLPTGSTRLPIDYRLVPANDRLANIDSDSYTNDETGIMPLAPVHITGHRNPTTKALSIGWMPRTRANIENLMGEDYDHGELDETYHLELHPAGSTAILRTLVVSDAHVGEYTLSMYQADANPSATDVPALDVDLYQISAVAGRGHPGIATV